MDDLERIKEDILAILGELTNKERQITEDKRRTLEAQLQVLLAFAQVNSADRSERVARGVFWLTVVLAICGVIQAISLTKDLICHH